MKEKETLIRWQGPIFVVGVPRSGTKLLRRLLNTHSEIFIHPHESRDIPYLLRRKSRWGDLRDLKRARRYYEYLSARWFFQCLIAKGIEPSFEEWYAEVSKGDGSVESGILAVFRVFSDRKGKRICGDKSPGYQRHVERLLDAWPEAKIIHIIRDPRDACLSIAKAWGVSLLRAAHQWNADMIRWRGSMSRTGPGRCLEVRYEELCDSPEAVLRGVCEFLNVEFEEPMTTLSSASEKVGDAKGQSCVVAGNHGKWRELLEKPTARRIEEIAFEGMEVIGYRPELAGGTRDLTRIRANWERMKDGGRLFSMKVRDSGLKRGLSFMRGAYQGRSH